MVGGVPARVVTFVLAAAPPSRARSSWWARPHGENAARRRPVQGEPGVDADKCGISLTIQYVSVFTALALCRTASDVLLVTYENLPSRPL